MIFNTLNGQQLFKAICSGCQTLINQKEALNRINVFPVADGDTGDNMASTARAIIMNTQASDRVTTTLQNVADASILGAHGNSGMIFSQFFNGLLDNTPELTETLTPQTFSLIIEKAAHSVRQAIATPIEGTLLTAIESWASLLNQSKQDATHFQDLVQHSLPPLYDVVLKTGDMLPELKDAHVVDAGALGFYHFVEGFHHYLLDPDNVVLDTDVLTSADFHDNPQQTTPPEHRYCTEALLNQPAIDIKTLTDMLQSHGDSVVVTGHRKRCRFHVHTNHPEMIFTKLKSLGQVEQPKVDDMLRQYEMNHHRKHKIALVADSSLDLPKVLIDEYQIHVIPLNLHLDDSHFLDGHSFDNNEFYDELKNLKKYPTTSFPPPQQIATKLKYIADHYEHVIVLNLAKALSGTHDAFVKASENIHNITVIDSKMVSAALGLVMLQLAKKLDCGAFQDELTAQASQYINHTKLFVLVNQLDSVIRSGRLNRIAGQIAKFAGLKPLLSLDETGKIQLIGKSFSTKKGLEKLLQYVKTAMQSTPNAQYAIVHAGNPVLAEEIAAQLTPMLSMPPAFIVPVATVLGLHTGKDCIGIAVLTES